MIVVRIELWKGGDKDRRETLGVMVLANDGTGGDDCGNYDVAIARRNGPGTWRSGRVEGHPRQSQTVWRLVQKALNACLPAFTAKPDRRQKELGL
jgi:hypothetical protein